LLNDDTYQIAQRMLEAGVRHLPVMEDNEVVGMISGRLPQCRADLCGGRVVQVAASYSPAAGGQHRLAAAQAPPRRGSADLGGGDLLPAWSRSRA
jgi:hypothetical protein